MSDQITDDLMQPEPEQDSSQPLYISPTLQNLSVKQRPQPSPACETCPASVWFNTNEQLKCFCSRMHLIVWDDQVTPIMACDGRELALLAMQEAQKE